MYSIRPPLCSYCITKYTHKDSPPTLYPLLNALSATLPADACCSSSLAPVGITLGRQCTPASLNFLYLDSFQPIAHHCHRLQILTACRKDATTCKTDCFSSGFSPATVHSWTHIKYFFDLFYPISKFSQFCVPLVSNVIDMNSYF